MKTKIKIVALFLLLFAVTITAPQKASAQGFSISFQIFYDELSPYGNWVFNPDYGYVWMPDVTPDFFPYATDGEWVFTDVGWTWVSYYEWGWAPFHYGRWFIDPFYGPMWVPGYEWGPGWVIWRSSGDCYGWAPIGPGVSYAEAYGWNYFMPYNHWRFVRNRDFGRPYIYNYYIDNSENVTIINNSTVINNVREDRSHDVTYNAGPDRHEVEKRAGRTVTPVVIKESTKTGAGKTTGVARQKTSQQVYRKQDQQQYGNPSGRTEAVKQPQQSSTAGRTEAVKQPQQSSTAGKKEAVKQPQHGNPSGKTEAVKQPQQSKPSGKMEAAKQQNSSSKNAGEEKNQQKESPSKKVR